MDLIDELKEHDRRILQAEQEAARKQRERDEFIAATKAFLDTFWPELRSDVRGKCEALRAHFPEKPERHASFAEMPDNALRISVVTERFVHAQRGEHSITVWVGASEHYDTYTFSYEGLHRLHLSGQLTSEALAEDLVRALLFMPPKLNWLPWYSKYPRSGGGAIQYG
jgi:hypothetical protein